MGNLNTKRVRGRSDDSNWLPLMGRRGAKEFRGLVAVSALMLALLPGISQAKPEMVGKVTQVSGSVEVSRDGRAWRAVKRSRLLFNGQYLRTGIDGSATIVSGGDRSNTIEVGSFSTLRVAGGTIETVPSNVQVVPEETGLSGFFSALQRRFQRTERYATVRRGGQPHQVEVAPEITLLRDRPVFVWQNAGPDYRYRLIVGKRKVKVRAVSPEARYVSFVWDRLPPGEYTYQIEVLDERGRVKFVGDKSGTVKVLDKAESERLSGEVDAFLADASKSDFEVGEFLLQQGLLVHALEHYESYLGDNPEELEMRYAMLQAYSALKLDHLRQQEARTFGLAAN